MEFNTIPEIIDDVRNGKMVILVDDEDRENEGDLILAAEFATPQNINFMVKEARGLVCLCLTAQQVERLQLPLMVRDDLNFAPNKTAFMVSIEASEGISTGISAADRALTCRVAANPHAKPADIHMPGHIFPIRAQQGGVLKRAGHTEASVDLARLAGLNPAAVICEVMNDDGTMARVGDLREFAKKHDIKIGTIVDLIAYRLANETLVEELHSVPLPASFGENMQARVFRSTVDGLEHLVIQKGEIKKDHPTLVRVHVDNFTRDFMAVVQRGASSVLESIKAISQEESGAFVLLRGNNRTTGLTQELNVLVGLEDIRPTTPLMDERDYGIGAQILRELGANKIRLLTNKPEKKVGLKAFDIEIVEIVAMENLKGPK
ncbi:3,4-dihydroxy-2-butanone-4-phosphate synthase [Bdellovibrio bacteriovorus]|uniref:3,4-dihydroxy-2-butanone 4-phosphate synthase n=1 Tax=Bdellovibrio bacteriovorus str. Tiberius TaxID=1069642 RepID=K7Z0S8_BDEBC|nr:3,4-dihydroxy-2-butanone-4-phosphate synthase [Bdellovibrio bacteriovorus]AFY02645.1 GTP cyclohydrolase II / 3,4-dihydroxy-2-butanone 4-phosphate synthase [Bdellovibrio bacteriovorus str. Tiberius]